MAYRVKLTRRARRDLDDIYVEKNAVESIAAQTWYFRLFEAILSLETHPKRCPATPESSNLRHLLFGNKPHIYRVIYRIIEKQRVVEILHIRHSAREKATGLK